MICDSMNADGFPAFRRSNSTVILKAREAMLLQRLQALICPGKHFFTCGTVDAA